MTRNPQPKYHGDDPIPKGPTFTSYIGWDQLGSSRMYQPEHAGWKQPAPCNLRAPGSRVQVINGRMTTSTTISSNYMKKFQAATREDVCPSLLVAIMIST